MNYTKKGIENLQIAYIGGGSRGWAWGLMSDLVSAEDISGCVRLYDIDKRAAENNVIIGHKFNEAEGAKSHWDYVATETIGEALDGADFVVISILPGTFDEMESDVHTPEKYGIYQSVGDTGGPGGIVRALRSIPMFEEIAAAIKAHCPEAWVINYTNPMTMLMRTLYRVFPEIKAFGCCHEVFGTQKLLAAMVTDKYGIENVSREEIKVEVTGVNHFTWLTKAQYRNIDLFPLYAEYAEKYAATGFARPGSKDENWMNNAFACNHRVKFDLFRRFGAIAAAAVAFKAGPILPQFPTLLLMCLAAMLAAGLYGVLAAALKVKFGTNETLMTLMLNYIALYLLMFLGETQGEWNFFLDPTSARPIFVSFSQLAAFPRIMFGKFGLNVCVILAFLLGALVHVYLKYTKHGYEIAVVGDSASSAHYAGMKVNHIVLRTVFLSACLIGLAAAFKVGTESVLSTAITDDVGWTGIIVAWLAQMNTAAIFAVSALISMLHYGSTAAAATFSRVDSSFANMLQGAILFLVLTAEFFIRFRVVRVQKGGSADGNG